MISALLRPSLSRLTAKTLVSVVAQAYESDMVESGTGLSVATAIEAMSVGLELKMLRWV